MLLAREALRQDLHRNDVVIADRLARNRSFLDPAEHLALPESIDEAWLLRDPVVRARLAQRLRHAIEEAADVGNETSDFVAPAVAPEVFVRVELLRFATATHAAAAARQLRRRPDPTAVEGTLSLVEAADGWLGHATLARQLGPQAAAAILALPVGAWSTPLVAPTGVYLARVLQRSATSPRPADRAVQARAETRARRRAEALAAVVARLRAGN